MPRLVREKLTAKRIAALPAPDPSGEQRIHFDSELRGFGVVCSGKTNAKTFIVQRDVKGKTRRLTVGPVNVFPLDKARKRAEELLADLYRGIDPKARVAGTITLQEALDDYLDARKEMRESTKRDYRRSIERHLQSWLKTPLGSITPNMIEKRHREIKEEIEADGQYAGGATANGVMTVLKTIWNFQASRIADLPPNPVTRLKGQKYSVGRRTRMVPESKLPEFYQAVCDLPNKVARDYILLLLFTGLRREEAASLTWTDVDLTEKVIRIPAARMKGKRPLDLPMSDFVYDLLKARRAIGDTGFVFPSDSESGHIAEPKYPFKLVFEATGIHVSAHDMRRNFMSAAEATEISPYAMKALVSHALPSGDVTAGYLQLSQRRLRQAAQRVTDHMKELCGVG